MGIRIDLHEQACVCVEQAQKTLEDYDLFVSEENISIPARELMLRQMVSDTIRALDLTLECLAEKTTPAKDEDNGD